MTNEYLIKISYLITIEFYSIIKKNEIKNPQINEQSLKKTE